MLPTKYFNVQLICLTFLLSHASVHADNVCTPPPTRTSPSTPGVCDVWISDPELQKHVTNIERTTEKTHESLQRLQVTLARQNRKSNFLIAAGLIAGTAYILDKDPALNAQVHQAIDTLKEKYTELTTYLQTAISGKPADEAPKTTNDNQSDKKE